MFSLKVLSCFLTFAFVFESLWTWPVSEPKDLDRRVSPHPIVLIVSFDGFRYDYLTKTSTPNFHKLIAGGVTVPWMEARFITKTFPNHHSIATGVYEETHQIVANSFYDPKLKASFQASETSAKWWDMGPTPLYTLNQLAGRRSGGMMWPGTNAWIKNQTCNVVYPYNNKVSWHSRVDTVIKWLTDPKKPVNVVFMYFENPDSAAHTYGPDSPQVVKEIKRADTVTGYLRSKLKDLGLWNKVSLIVTSDHGMASVPAKNLIVLSDFMDVSQFKMYGSSPVYSIQANNPADTYAIYKKLYKASLGRPFKVYLKQDIPEIYHYQHSDRILPILVVANDHWDISANKYSRGTQVTGNHGYNNSLTDMHPFFIAHGPQFKRGYKGAVFKNIDIYPLACCLLGLQPAPNNGSFSRVSCLLSDTSLVSKCSRQPNMYNG